MFNFIVAIFRVIFMLFSARKMNIIIENTILKKENEILKRNNKKRISFLFFDRLFYTVLCQLSEKGKDFVSLIKPETVYKWQRNLIKGFWTFPSNKPRIGRPPVPVQIKELILEMKNRNLYWGYKRIQGELLKLGIELDRKTIWNILHDFRRKGKVKRGVSWERFLKSHIKSLYAMDFFTVDTVLNQRFYVFFIIRHETREIIQFGLTMNPVKEFVRQQMIEFVYDLRDRIYLIHDRAGEFGLKYKDYGIQGIKTSVKAPNMNAIAERFIGSVRREILDHFIIIGQHQLYQLLKAYIGYYNTKRPHQGIEQRVPKGYSIRTFGRIKCRPTLFGLNYEFYREAA